MITTSSPPSKSDSTAATVKQQWLRTDTLQKALERRNFGVLEASALNYCRSTVLTVLFPYRLNPSVKYGS